MLRRSLAGPSVGVLAMALMTLVLVACSGSSASKHPAQGASGDAGPIAVRNAVLVSGPEGSSSATLVATLVNGSASADALTGVQVADPAPTATYLTGGSIAVPPNSPVGIGHAGQSYVNLYGFTPRSSQVVAVTLVFRDHGSTTLNVKVVPPTGTYAGIAPSPTAAPAS